MVNGLSGEHPRGGIDFPRKIESRLLGELPAAQWQSTLFLRASVLAVKFAKALNRGKYLEKLR